MLQEYNSEIVHIQVYILCPLDNSPFMSVNWASSNLRISDVHISRTSLVWACTRERVSVYGVHVRVHVTTCIHVHAHVCRDGEATFCIRLYCRYKTNIHVHATVMIDVYKYLMFSSTWNLKTFCCPCMFSSNWSGWPSLVGLRPISAICKDWQENLTSDASNIYIQCTCIQSRYHSKQEQDEHKITLLQPTGRCAL